MQVLTQLAMVPLVSAAFCAIAGQIRRKHLPPGFNLFFIQAWLAVAVELSGQLSMILFPHKSNHILFNIYMPFDFILIFLAGHSYVENKSKSFNWIGVAIYLLVWSTSLLLRGAHTMANFSIICGAFIITIRYIQVLLWNSRQPSGPQNTGLYFIAVSVLLYYCCIIPVFSLMYYFISKDMVLAGKMYDVNTVLASLRYLGTGIGLLIASKAFRSNNAIHV